MGEIADKIRKSIVRELEKLGGSKNPNRKIRKLMQQVEKEPQVEQMGDPLMDTYIMSQHLSSIFSEGMSLLPALKRYEKIVGDYEEIYRPRGLPTSPMTGSYFTNWAFYDFRINKAGESIASCQLELRDIFQYTDQDCEVFCNQLEGRMGIYEHLGWEGNLIRLRELLTEKECLCTCMAEYNGQQGELWYVRLCEPLIDSPDARYLALTTPYILVENTKKDWEDFLRRTLPKTESRPDESKLHNLLKYGLSNGYWHEFIMAAYDHHISTAIFLAGIPDIYKSMPRRWTWGKKSGPKLSVY